MNSLLYLLSYFTLALLEFFSLLSALHLKIWYMCLVFLVGERFSETKFGSTLRNVSFLRLIWFVNRRKSLIQHKGIIIDLGTHLELQLQLKLEYG